MGVLGISKYPSISRMPPSRDTLRVFLKCQIVPAIKIIIRILFTMHFSKPLLRRILIGRAGERISGIRKSLKVTPNTAPWMTSMMDRAMKEVGISTLEVVANIIHIITIIANR